MFQRHNIGAIILGTFFICAGVMHFLATDGYVAMMPIYIPWQRGLVYLSGAFEIAGGLGVMIPPIRRFAGIGLIVLLIAVFPANAHVALHGLPVASADLPVWGLWLRLPLQFLLIYWVAKITLFDETFEPYSAS